MEYKTGSGSYGLYLLLSIRLAELWYVKILYAVVYK